MTATQALERARELGFDEIGALNPEQVREALARWRERAGDAVPERFAGADPANELPEATAALLLAYPYHLLEGYPEGVGRVSGYYAASQRAYVAARALVAFLCEGGYRAVLGRSMPVKPLAQAAGLGRYGRNGVIVRRGSHMALQLVLCDLPAGDFPRPRAAWLPCDTCGRCEGACPTGALREGRVDTALCLRNYMEGEDVPPALRPLMGDRLLGCDECLNACPGMVREEMPPRWAELFAWEALEDEARHRENRREIAEIVGKNYAGKVRKRAMTRRRDDAGRASGSPLF